MTQRVIQSGPAPTLIVRAGGTVQVQGRAIDQVVAESLDRWGMQVRRRGATIEVSIGRSGELQVPAGSSVTVYAGQSVGLRDVGGAVAVYAGGEARLQGVGALAHAAAGGALAIECRQLAEGDLRCTAGGDLRLQAAELTNARLMVNDLGGYWEARIGDGRATVRLTAGGDVTLVTDQDVRAVPPDFILGKIERPL